MNTTILAFGIAKDFFGGSSIEVELKNECTVEELKRKLETIYPEMKKLQVYMVAVNNEYADDGIVIHPKDEVAIIPPVSGG